MIEVGDTVSIPATTVLYEYMHGYTPERFESLTRAKRVVVNEMVDLSSQWLGFAPKDVLDDLSIHLKLLTGREYQTKYLLGWIALGRIPELKQHRGEVEKLMIKAKAATDEIFGGDYNCVVFGDRRNKMAVRLVDVTKSEPVAKKAPVAKKEAELTKRRLMVIGSKWRFTKDVALTAWVENPKIAEMVTKRHAASPSGNRTIHQGGQIIVVMGGGRQQTADEKRTQEQCQTEINRLLRDEPQVQVPLADIKAGTEFEVVDNIAPGHKHHSGKKSNGLLVPVTIKSGIVQHTEIGYYRHTNLPYSQIEPFVEALEIPETLIHVFRDTDTGLYFRGWEMAKSPYGDWNTTTDTPKYSNTISGSKKYKTISAAKASIRDFTGYTGDVVGDGYDGPQNEFCGGEKKMDLPPNWELVTIDKTTNTEKGITDVQNWYRGLLRLKVLTVQYGSAVRAVYKKAEGKGMEAILVFKLKEDYLEDNPEVVALIDKAANNMAGKTLRERSNTAIAFAASFDDAVLCKMATRLSDGVSATMLDINTLEEVVG